MSKHSVTNFFDQANYISVYTRNQAIEDGILADVSGMTKEAGFTLPIAVTSAVWERYVFWTEQDSKRQTSQDTNGRLWDVLWMLRCSNTVKRMFNVHPNQCYALYVVPRGGRATKAKLTKLKAVLSGGHNGEAVITIMLPEED